MWTEIAAIALSRKFWQIWWRSAVLISQIPTSSRGLPRMSLLLRLIGKPSMPRGRKATPITQPTNHPKKAPGAEHAKDNTRTEKGDRSQSLRFSLQQTRLRGSGTLLVAEVHPAQCAH